MSAVFAVIFANLKGNLGDFAILHSMLADIRKAHPGCEIDVYSQPFVSVDEARFEAFKRLAPPFRYKGAMADDPRPLTPGMVRALRAFGALRYIQERRVSRLARKVTAEFGQQFSQYAAVYIAGGAQWTGVNAGVSMFAHLRGIASRNAHIRSYPVSVSPSLRNVNLRASMADDFKKIGQPLIARDSGTRKALGALGLDVTLGADCVFALASLFDGRRNSTPSSNRLLLVLTNQTADDIERAVTEAKRAGFDPALLSTCAIEDGAVQREAAARTGVQFIAPLTWQEVVAEMDASAIVVTNRLHGLILTSFSSACILPLVDRQKVRAVVGDAALPVSVETLAQLDAARLALARQRADEIRDKLRAYRNKALQLPWSPIALVSRDESRENPERRQP